ncbi:class I SAM-dependent RNA methyltransferase [Varunaivibrio sulfuroxidans]|uniref:23S rRNA m(5)U-1939 methyltransferase n=1 Tax=Varunaivibrio sulfuroxidans TaxID=1773489 RepID=A0A4R3JAH9_9PROT|nr:class I SAM-dependent RNA methyltransferase [Varunaivibrio sulfuroxidans]TCS62642.1 23S rRNA m(5)U-1939 methyltransferase [Varunaivibrio sulfuroxidans]WES30692.1 class I SAM-dependent RNA methyltransferase [Varunaivibrio sulfuroxidans]
MKQGTFASRPRKRRPKKGAKSPQDGRKIDAEVETIGGQGDGLVHLDGALYFAPDTVPGDRITARVGAARGGGHVLEDIVRHEDGPTRIRPFCGHAGACGGCVAQHMSDAAYRLWKVERIGEALTRRGLGDVEIEPLVTTPLGARRRLTLSAVRRGGKVSLGFNARRAHRVVDLEGCPLAAPALCALFAPLRDLFAALAREGLALDKAVQVLLTACDGGLDAVFRASCAPNLNMRQRLVDFAARFDLARVSWDNADGAGPEAIVVHREPYMTFAGTRVALPQGGFLQASAEGERAITAAIARRVGGAARIAELYCGMGSFTFALAQIAPVFAVEGFAPAVRALERAAGRAGLGGMIRAEVRDLDRAPLDARELKRFDTVVFDPPRAGAAAQAAALAHGAARTIVAVSCNPATFARDARILVDGGYALQSLTPIDQFAYSAHVELVAGFAKK